MINLKKIGITFLIGTTLLTGCTNSKPKTEKINKEENYAIIRGMNYGEAGKYDESIKAFLKAYSINPNNIMTVRSLGLVYSRAGDTATGEKYFLEALKIDKYDKEALYNYAILKYDVGKYDEALELLNTIKIENVDNRIYIARGGIYYKLKNYEKSFQEFTKIIGDDDYSKDIYQIYIDVMQKSGRGDKIYEFTYNLYKKNVNDKDKMDVFKDYLIFIGAYDEAEKVLKEYTIKNGYSLEITLDLINVTIKNKKYDSAKAYWSLIPEDQNLNIKVLEMKSYYYKELGMQEEAAKYESILKNVKGAEK